MRVRDDGREPPRTVKAVRAHRIQPPFPGGEAGQGGERPAARLAHRRALAMRLLVASVAGVGLFVALVFWPAGRFGWVAGWLYVVLFLANMLANVVYLKRVNPALIEARTRLGQGTKLWDLVWSGLFTPVFVAIFVVAGFDSVRFGWSAMSPWFWPVGLALYVPGMLLFGWAMGVNPFFEKTVRIQTERGHRVIDTGPYRLVRHPGYLGFLGWTLSTPLLLGSWWAFVPALLSVVAIVLRTCLEDRTLMQELAGYEDYARRVRYKLIPRIW